MADRRTHRSELLCALALWLGLFGCKPTIHSFRADPNVICPGSAVRLGWDASSGGEITSAPPLPGLGSVPATGTQEVRPTAPTRFRLEAHNLWGGAAREVDVDVRAAANAPKSIGASIADPSARCEDGILSVEVVPPEGAWDEHARVGEVEVPQAVSRHYHVEHEGRSAELDPGVRSAAFAGLPVRGRWLLSTPLGPGETCGPELPRNLLIDIYPSCTTDAP